MKILSLILMFIALNCQAQPPVQDTMLRYVVGYFSDQDEYPMSVTFNNEMFYVTDSILGVVAWEEGDTIMIEDCIAAFKVMKWCIQYMSAQSMRCNHLPFKE